MDIIDDLKAELNSTAPISVCAYSVSGAYGDTPRYLYMLCLFVGTIFHSQAWFARAMFGGAMLYSAITAVHGLALISLSTPATAELDTLPIYAITMIGLFNSPYLVFHCKDFRRAYAGTRVVVYAWLVLMMAGSLASVWNVSQLDEASTVCPQRSPVGYGRTRRGQLSDEVVLSSFLVRCLQDQSVLGWLIPPLMLMIWVIGEWRWLGQWCEDERLMEESAPGGEGNHLYVLPVHELMPVQHPGPGHDETDRYYCGGDDSGSTGSGSDNGGGWKCMWELCQWIFLKSMSYLIPAMSFVCQCWLLYATQRIMLMLPNQEDRDAIGQWGPLAGTVIAVVAALVAHFGDPQPVMVDVKTVAGPSRL
ncbi:hypothetical protein DFP73DRAFT_620251 [Morchella snyderi]|nr:hypothetical protein DFP73DRAFT_620251 [Morchella snyderi]